MDETRRLNIAAILPETQALGPGRRFAVWVQGCCFDCPGCVAPQWIPQVSNQLWEVDALARRIAAQPGLQGVTLSGGEPFLQASALACLIRHIRAAQPAMSVICYTGWRLEALREHADGAEELLGLVDVLIDGVYRADLNDGAGLRGSSNQRVHFLSGVYSAQADLFSTAPRRFEIHTGPEREVMFAGIPPRHLPLDLNGLLQPIA